MTNKVSFPTNSDMTNPIKGFLEGNEVNIFQNGVFQDGRQRDNEKIKKSIDKPRFRENGHKTLKYDHTKWKLN